MLDIGARRSRVGLTDVVVKDADLEGEETLTVNITCVMDQQSRYTLFNRLEHEVWT